jgi:carbamoyltransferase
MVILGLHKDPWHNTGAAVIREGTDGVRFANLSEERANREKDSRRFPRRSIEACLAEVGVSSSAEVDLIVLDYIVQPDWTKDWHRVPCETNNLLSEADPGAVHVVNHHLAHACSVFYSSPFESAAILVVDGRGSNKETQSLFVGTPDGIELLESTPVIGIGLLYAAVTQAIGFGLLQEGKTMGLAPYGQAIKKQIFRLPRQYDGVVTDYSSVCIEDSYEMKGSHAPILTFDDKARAAFEVQTEAESALLHLAQYARERTGAEYLCLSGGVALNSVANYRLLRSGIFKDIFINPAASDTGIPLGAALYGYHAIKKRPRTYSAISPFLGPSYSEKQIRAVIESYSDKTSGQGMFRGFYLIEHHALEEAVKLLVANRILGCFQGRSEMGPRALGNRSILMSAFLPDNKDTLNLRVKHRESFRPFAPAVLEEHTADYFFMDRPSPYMLMVARVVEEKRQTVPAVVHVDGTGRLQTVGKTANPHLYSIIESFNRRTGVPVLLNTSFNVANEPIVETPEDAVRCFLGTDIDALFIGPYLLVKEKTIEPI